MSAIGRAILTLVGGLASVPGYPSRSTNIAGVVLLGHGVGTVITAAACFVEARKDALSAAMGGIR